MSGLKSSLFRTYIQTMKKILVVLAIVSLLSCCTLYKIISVKEVAGTYRWSCIYGVGSEIELNIDSTFQYTWFAGLNNGVTEGVWTINKNKIVLNSEKQPGFGVTREYVTVSDSTTICIDQNSKLLDDVELGFTSAVLVKVDKSKKNIKFDSQMCITFLTKQVDSIYITSMFKEPIHLSVEELKSNNYYLEMKEWRSHYRYFTDEEWLYKRGRIYNPAIKKDRNIKENYYKRIKE